jgi:hypothetical protein
VHFSRAALPLLHGVPVVLLRFRNARPEECYSLRRGNVTWGGGRNDVLLIAKAKRRRPGAFCRLAFAFGRCWRTTGRRRENQVWRTDTKDVHINHDSLKLYKASILSKVCAFEVYSICHTFVARRRITCKCLKRDTAVRPLTRRGVWLCLAKTLCARKINDLGARLHGERPVEDWLLG